MRLMGCWFEREQPSLRVVEELLPQRRQELGGQRIVLVVVVVLVVGSVADFVVPVQLDEELLQAFR